MEPLAWYIAGPLIGLTVPLLLLIREKQLGVSSSFRVAGSFLLPKVDYFKYNREKDYWQVFFVMGILIASVAIFNTTDFGIPPSTNVEGEAYFQAYDNAFLPIFFVGSIFIGFGARYANGCTAGHCIMGNSQFALSSLITTVFFFVGGLIATHFIVPLIFTT
ncbi:MAG: YeeE/YedE family protein [bacterium]|nr:YeeE/YedE family protein [bacterium]